MQQIRVYPATGPQVDVWAANTTHEAVQTAIDDATSGQTVGVPAGSSTWDTTVSVTGKALTIIGAGIGQTVITDNAAGDCFYVECSATNFVDVSGITFVKQTPHTNGMVYIGSAVANHPAAWFEVGFRFHHCRLYDNGVAGGRGIVINGGYGLIDHCTFDVEDTTSSDQMISPNGSYGASDGGFTPWQQDLSLGTNKAVYVEDCTFNYANQNEDAIDAYYGARFVIRHNTFNHVAVGYHGCDSGDARSPVSCELYDNVFHNDGVGKRALTIRGGTGVMFNNTYGGNTGWDGFHLFYYRAQYRGSSSWGDCEGSDWDIGSANFSDQQSRRCWAADTGVRFLAANPDTVSAVGTRYFDGDGSYGYPARDQPGRGPNGQTLSPLYQWNNGSITFGVHTNEVTDPAAVAPGSNWMTANRDYYDYTASFDGSVGVGRGLLSARPSSGLTAGVGYFATDTNTLYVATNATTWATYYTPYTYPHPLVT